VPTQTSPAPQLPGLGARHAITRPRRRRWGAVVVVSVVILAVAAAATTVIMLSRSKHLAPAPRRAASPPTVVGAVVPWQLQAPIAAEVVLPAPPAVATPTLLEVFGGSTTGAQPAQGIYALDVSSGRLLHVANLQTTLADAAGAVIGGNDVVLGGNGPAAVATVQALPTSGSRSGGAVPLTTVVGSLPQPRAGAATVSVGSTTYLVGGANGNTPHDAILATVDGSTYSVVARLRVPVAYPAVAAVGTRLYVFGGMALAGPGTGQPVATIQVVDPGTHKVTTRGRLPVPVAGAVAFTLAGHVFIAGGDMVSPNAAAGPLPTSDTIWSFDPTTSAVHRAGRLSVPVSHAGTAVLGDVAWLVGGTSAGAPTASVQTVSPNPTTGPGHTH
jgi:hypothetical protein